MMSQGRTKDAVRLATDDKTHYIADPTDEILTTDNKKAKVSSIMRAKHPNAAPLLRDAFEEFTSWRNDSTSLPQLTTLTIIESDIESMCRKLHGSAGLSGVDSASFVRLLTCHGEASTKYRSALARYTTLKASRFLDWHKIQANRAGRSLALAEEASNKIRPLLVGEVEERLGSKVIMHKTGGEATKTCGAQQVCSGVKGGAEALVHATERVHEAGSRDLQTSEAGIDGENEDIADDSDDPWCTMLMDASNAFNEMNRKQGLLRIRRDWPSAAMYIFNCYRGAIPIVLRSKESARLTTWLQGEEGTSQGCPMAMAFFGVATMPLHRMLNDLQKSAPQLSDRETRQQPEQPSLRSSSRPQTSNVIVSDDTS